ncbi:hypothetical protein LRR18_00655 [Mangrovimonas sp. AS39]|uniref:hypothetical protein n=1 Tax=Mangrovimonas TaxID=1211036 RepID=UPI0006B628DE|nr:MULTISPECIES: hypothetical protein [Mangrovimonas]MCF1190076.1 hypothetical protein [Mangrovimonas futianensis]MCF1194173.1 hypothetical protein [Mangrovimonas futianensis]MCF1421745.1 hypothetical protein [Mangrovimonas futianensis]NIK90644.1 hypothetical protein [Mangrovimonas sp. CR14]
MRILIIILSVLALILMAFNITQIDFDHPFEGQSIIALITILASLCALVLLQILRISKKIEKQIGK